MMFGVSSTLADEVQREKGKFCTPSCLSHGLPESMKELKRLFEGAFILPQSLDQKGKKKEKQGFGERQMEEELSERN